MTIKNKDKQVKGADDVYRFQSGKCTITLKFSDGDAAPSVEEALEKILVGRME